MVISAPDLIGLADRVSNEQEAARKVQAAPRLRVKKRGCVNIFPGLDLHRIMNWPISDLGTTSATSEDGVLDDR